MKKMIISVPFLTIVLFASLLMISSVVSANSVWPRPIVPPLPDSVTNVTTPKVSLNGTWKFTKTPPTNFWDNSSDPATWPNVNDVQIPSDLSIKGFWTHCGKDNCLTDKDKEFPYKKQIAIPSEFAGKRIFLRFEAAYNFARVWVNGNLVRTHIGAFSEWDADITDYVTPGSDAWVTIGVTAQDTSVAFFHQRGITRDLTLYAAPQDYAMRLHASTDLDADYNNATLKVESGVVFKGGSNATVNLSLKDPSGKDVALAQNSISISLSNPEGSISIPVTAPLKWDAEHPNLYTLTGTFVVDGKTTQTIVQKIGFREIQVSGQKVLVNGKPVNLRGVAYQHTYATEGFRTSAEEHRKNFLKLKAANINYIRTAHMAPPKVVLDLADELGMFVEYETSVMFNGGEKTNAPARTEEYMTQFSENVEADKTHPSILYWSIANESAAGSNMTKMLDYIKLEDPTRPNKHSWGYNGVNTSIYSVHYQTDSPSSTKPTIYDELAHGFYVEPAFDPGIRDYYGEYLSKYWEGMYANKGILGGALWTVMDASFQTAGSNGVNANWGTTMDAWGREKPEYYNVKEVFSPNKITGNALVNPGANKPLIIKVENRHDFTNMSEMNITYNVGSSSGTVNANIDPRATGTITIPARDWKLGEVLNLKFTNPQGYLENEYNLTIGKPLYSFADPSGSAPAITEDSTSLTVTGTDYALKFSKSTGMITSGIYSGSTVLTGGPYLNMGKVSLSAWTFKSIKSSTVNNEAVITIDGTYGSVGATFAIQVDGTGLIRTTYTVTNPPSGYSEVGVGYDVTGNADTLSWLRNGKWTSYPSDHIGRNAGQAIKHKPSGQMDTYGVKPTWSWSLDEKNFGEFGANDPGDRGTNDFRSSKTYFIYGSLILNDSNIRLRAEGDGTGSIRAQINGSNTRLNINNLWAVPTKTQCCDNFAEKNISIANGYSNTVQMRLTNSDTVNTAYTNNLNLDPTLKLSATSVNSDPQFSLDKALDRDLDTSYKSGDSPSFPEYYTMKWPTGRTIDTVSITCGSCQDQGITNFDVEVSDDGTTNWTRVASSGDITNTSNSGYETKTIGFRQVANKKGVRIKINNANLSSNHFAINEIFVGRLVELATASASSVKGDKNFSPDKAIDGNPDTSYVSTDSPGFPQYYTLDWPSGQTFNTVNISCAYCSDQGVKNFDVEVSDDGSTNWTRVATSGTLTYNSDSGIQTKSIFFPQVTNKKGFRIKINNANLTWKHFVLNEVVVTNTAPSAVVSIKAPADVTVPVKTEKTATALGLPGRVTIVTDVGSMDAIVTWDLSTVNYDQNSDTAQTFTVPGTVTLPADVTNPNNVPLTTSISVSTKLVELVAHWKFDEGSGTTVGDSSGKGNIGTLVNNPTWTDSGKIGGALTFSGGSRVEINAPATLNQTGDETVSLWFKTSQPATSTTSIFRQDKRFTALQLAGGKAQVAYWPNSSSNLKTLSFPWTYSDNQWHHYVASYDSSTGLKIYVDGNVVASDTMNLGPLPAVTNKIALGAAEFGGEAYNGLLDDVRVFDLELTQDQVSQLMNAGIDQQAPTTTDNAPNGWVNQDTTITLSTSDNGTGVVNTYYTVDGGAEQTGTSVVLSEEGVHKLVYWSVDKVGNVEQAHTVSFSMDKKAPSIAVTVPGDNSIYEDSGDLTPQINLTDNLSGVDSSKTTVTLNTYSYQIGTTITLYKLPLGQHTLVVSSSDLAGNQVSKTVQFTTATSIDSLKALVKRFANNKEINKADTTTSLLNKLANNDLKGFVNLVNAQSGKSISSKAAGYLLRDAQYLLTQK
ncbi:glycoside hydrolase family 2 TIM barrel-domain containing protein [Paenibacillus sp. PL91]|uniref:glycoside hydrolase family 2 TIM barrel-domain containing protein n=1 Tax=Paenibacillus sp. PL91 TaxID=2729538 RepID=UPI00145F7D05|nr:glycoside hydrolase family 2 TIM barrel-domain containing protein [Paenibacillus sp. PL91]MBC9204064.1 discoidin domain-containing protein [Paenibacillus sp. PL91]